MFHNRALAIVAVATLASVVSVVSVACSRAPREYVIGVAAPQTTGYGIQNRRGVDLAVDEINRTGGVAGVPLRTIVRDDRARGADAARIAGEFVSNPRVVAVVGHAGSAAEVAAAPVYDAGRLVAVAPTPSSPDLTGVSPWVFRIITSDSVNGQTLAQFADGLAPRLGRPPRAAVLYQNDAYGRGLSEAFRRSFHGPIVSVDPVGSDIPLEPYVSFYRRARPDIVFVASTEDIGIALLREARRQQFTATFLGGDGWQGTVVEPAAEGAYVGAPFTAASRDTAARRFVAAFRARYGVLPDAHAALAYDATRLVARALEASAGTRGGVRQYLAALSSATAFHGVAGPTWFSATNDPANGTFRITRIERGRLLPVETGPGADSAGTGR